MEIQRTYITSGNLVGEVKSSEAQAYMALLEEVEILMNKYKVDYMWFAWSKGALENNCLPRAEHDRLIARYEAKIAELVKEKLSE